MDEQSAGLKLNNHGGGGEGRGGAGGGVWQEVRGRSRHGRHSILMLQAETFFRGRGGGGGETTVYLFVPLPASPKTIKTII